MSRLRWRWDCVHLAQVLVTLCFDPFLKGINKIVLRSFFLKILIRLCLNSLLTVLVIFVFVFEKC